MRQSFEWAVRELLFLMSKLPVIYCNRSSSYHEDMFYSPLFRNGSSSKWKKMWKTIQVRANSPNVVQVVQLILNMKVQWSSTYLMLDRAKRKNDMHNKFHGWLVLNDSSWLFFFGSVLMLLLMSFDGKNQTPLNVIRFVSSSSWVRSGHRSRPSLVY
jgi:hypothetical protein